MINKLINLILLTQLCVLVSSAFAQSGFDAYIAKDSTYRFNISLNRIDSLINNSIVADKKDTSFYNIYGKAETINLSQLLYLTVNNDPELAAMQSEIESQKVLSKEKGILPDPMLSVETDNVASNFQKVEMINFFASQMFPFPGKLKLESESAMHNMDMFFYEKKAAAADKMNKVKQAYYDLYFNTKKQQVNRENQQLIKTFMTAAEGKYSVGKGMQSEVLKAQIEMSRLSNEEFIIEQQRKNIYSDLTKLSKTVIDDNTRISFTDVDAGYLEASDNFDYSDADANKMVDYAFLHRADLKVIEHKSIMGKYELDKAKLSRMPDFNVQIGYKILPFNDHNGFEFMVGVNVPIAPWSSGKYDYAIQRTEINIKSANEEYDFKRTEIRNEITNIVNNIHTSKETMNYYSGVLMPQAENTLKSTQYSYENNLTQFLDLLDSFKMYQEAKLMYWESVNINLKMIAELEKAIGLNLK
jgi:cobalt-zinc-cadmium efflux system outer membrane protein